MEIVTNEQEFTETEVISSEPKARPITIGEQQIGIRFTADDMVFGNNILKAHANLVNGLWEYYGIELERLKQLADEGNPNQLPLSLVQQKQTDFSLAVTNIVTAARHFRAAITNWE